MASPDPPDPEATQPAADATAVPPGARGDEPGLPNVALPVYRPRRRLGFAAGFVLAALLTCAVLLAARLLG
jgi:hypothetical protein